MRRARGQECPAAAKDDQGRSNLVTHYDARLISAARRKPSVTQPTARPADVYAVDAGCAILSAQFDGLPM